MYHRNAILISKLARTEATECRNARSPPQPGSDFLPAVAVHLQAFGPASRPPLGSLARALPRAHTHRLVLVLQATGGHIRHGRGCRGSLRAWLPSPHVLKRRRSALPCGPNDAGLTHRTGTETGSFPLPGRAPEVCVGRVSGDSAQLPVAFWVGPTQPLGT